MERWRAVAGASAHHVSEHPELWVPGALGWLVSVGWIPFIVTVLRPPSVSDLTFVGARLVTSGAWPWNAVIVGAGVLAVVGMVLALAAGANATLIALDERRAARIVDAIRLFQVSVMAGLPAALATGTLLAAVAVVAPGQFNAPDPPGGPLLSTLGRLLPFLVLVGATGIGALMVAAIGGRLAVARHAGPLRAIASSTRHVLRGAELLHAAASLLAAGLLIGLATMMLGVLWAPIRADLGASGAFDLATGSLLVGFVAVWLGIVLAGGALHAWSATTWSRLVATDAP